MVIFFAQPSSQLSSIGAQCKGERHDQVINRQREALTELRARIKALEKSNSIRKGLNLLGPTYLRLLLNTTIFTVLFFLPSVELVYQLLCAWFKCLFPRSAFCFNSSHTLSFSKSLIRWLIHFYLSINLFIDPLSSISSFDT